MNSDIINKIENYFASQKEQFGDILFIEQIEKEQVQVPIANKALTEPQQKPILKKDKPLIILDEGKDLFIEEPDWKKSKSLVELNDKICNCKNCPLGKTRTNFVFGVGNPNADIVVIGEAPGADEDAQGEPFVGRAGQLLTKILEAIKFKREEVYICNILKCRPPDNRKPLPSEEDECEPYLLKQIELIRPTFILTLGLTAADRLLKTKNKMGDIRGKTFDYHGIKMLVTYHPAALLRNPNWKVDTWQDVKLLRKLYDEFLLNN